MFSSSSSFSSSRPQHFSYSNSSSKHYQHRHQQHQDSLLPSSIASSSAPFVSSTFASRFHPNSHSNQPITNQLRRQPHHQQHQNGDTHTTIRWASRSLSHTPPQQRHHFSPLRPPLFPNGDNNSNGTIDTPVFPLTFNSAIRQTNGNVIFGTLPRQRTATINHNPPPTALMRTTIVVDHQQQKREAEEEEPHPYCTVEEIKEGKKQQNNGTTTTTIETPNWEKQRHNNNSLRLQQNNGINCDQKKMENGDDYEEDDEEEDGFYERAPEPTSSSKNNSGRSGRSFSNDGNGDKGPEQMEGKGEEEEDGGGEGGVEVVEEAATKSHDENGHSAQCPTPPLLLLLPPPPSVEPPLPPPQTPKVGTKNAKLGNRNKLDFEQQMKNGNGNGENKELLVTKQRLGRTKFWLVCSLLLLITLLLALPLLLLLLVSNSTEWHLNKQQRMRQQYNYNTFGTTENRQRNNLSAGQKSAEEKMATTTTMRGPPSGREVLVEPATLLEWMQQSTIRENGSQQQQRLRVFEVREGKSVVVGTANNEKQQHIGSVATTPLSSRARPLPIGSLSHNGVPVHPLQFQRIVRAQGVNSDSMVVFYDRHPFGLLAAYALWLFRLYGHDNCFLLNGGADGWQQMLAMRGLDGMAVGNEPMEDEEEGEEEGEQQQLKEKREGRGGNANDDSEGQQQQQKQHGMEEEKDGGNFRAEWRSQLIATFDDLLANFEPKNNVVLPRADLTDAQSVEEFNGNAGGSSNEAASSSNTAIYGHIRTAVNLPIERLFTAAAGSNSIKNNGKLWEWTSAASQAQMFAAVGLTQRRPVIVYDGFSSLRSAALWAALHRTNFTASVYFGAWPEWLIRAPDHLKIIPGK